MAEQKKTAKAQEPQATPPSPIELAVAVLEKQKQFIRIPFEGQVNLLQSHIKWGTGSAASAGKQARALYEQMQAVRETERALDKAIWWLQGLVPYLGVIEAAQAAAEAAQAEGKP